MTGLLSYWRRPELAAMTSQGLSRPLTIVFVRHGEPLEAAPDGRSDPDLTPRGRSQARRLARRLAREPFDHIYTSDLARAYRTAEAVARFHDRTPFTVSRALREISASHCEPYAPLPSEPERSRLEQERAALSGFVRLLAQAHRAGQLVLIAAHGNLIRAMIPMLADGDPRTMVPMEIFHTSVTVVDRWPAGRIVLRLLNCAKHLSPEGVT